MKSPQVANVIQNEAERARYTDLMVLRSPAGYYIGTMYNAPEGWQEPGSRDSGYYIDEESAQSALDSKSWKQRINP